MSISQKEYSIIINLLTVVPAIVKQVPEAIELYNRMMDALKDNSVSEEEWGSLLEERDALIASIEDATDE